MFPMITPVISAIKPAARPVRRRVNAPRWPAGLPQRGKNCIWIPRFERHIDRARVFVVKQNFLPALSAIFRTKNSALRVRTVRMTQRRGENPVWVARVHEDPPDLPRILQPDVHPRFAAVRGLV